ncbi:hypothetical protein R3I93_004709 [Phoxinus phoxinus]|uniref:GRIP domain-containing protein n=1 Tax=Phoxinus phoxinus TaxID=58324 RepID=A0AAN9DBY5_9TELE
MEQDASAEAVTSPHDANAVTSPQDANAEAVTSPHDANAESVTSPAGQSGKSKLDTLSKEDLIKFAKKQMVAMQRMKSKCADLEKEVEVLKRPASGSADPSVIQELSERMSAVLQEKAESQQSLALLRREHEELRKQAQETEGRLAALQEELDLKNRECTEMQRSTAELTAGFKAACTEYESTLSRTQEELLQAKQQWTATTEALREAHQMSLTESQQEVENLQREMERLSKQCEDELRYLEEQMELNAADFERERERLLLLQDELSEQLALKEGFLQDVQEEEEDSNRAAPPEPAADSSASDDSSDEGGGLKLALEDLQAQNMMFQEELVFLRNVKVELESELKQVREEFTVEKEELEFTINELQMSKDSGEASVGKSREARSISNEDVRTLEESHNKDSRQLEACFSSSAERDQPEHVINSSQDRRSPPPEDESMITHNNLRDGTEHFMKQYRAMKEQTVSSLQGLQEELESFFQERDSLLEHINAEDMPDHAGKMSFEDLRNKTEEILGNLQHKETLVLEFMASESEREHKETLVLELEEKLKFMASEREHKETLVLELEEKLKFMASEREHKDTLVLELEEKQKFMASEREHKETLVLELEEKLKFMACESEREHKAQLAQVSALENRLLSVSVEKDERINLLEKERSALQARQEECQDTIKRLQAQIVCLSEEGNALRRDMDASQEHLSDVRSHIAQILKQSFSETELDGTSDVSTLINHLLSKSQEEKAVLTQQSDESVERLTAELESARQSAEERQVRVDELLREKHLSLEQSDESVERLTAELESARQSAEERQACVDELLREKHLQKASLEEKALLTQQSDESVERLTAELESARQSSEEHQARVDELLREKHLQKASLEEKALLTQQSDESVERLTAELESARQSAEERQAHVDELFREKHLLKASLEEKALLTQQNDESVERLTAELESARQLAEERQVRIDELLREKHLSLEESDESVERLTAELESARQSAEERQARVDELVREKHLLKASLEEVLLDTEGLQKDLSEVQAMNEKLRAENLSLLTQVADLSQSSEKKEPADETDAQVHEANELQQVLADKDTLISQLKEEVGLLQTCKESAVSDENEKMKELSHEMELLRKASKDKEERMNKIKAVAVKAKKELDSSKKEAGALREEVEQLKAERDRLARSVKDIIHGAEHYKNLLVDYDKQTELLEQAKTHSEDLSRRLQSAVQQHELLSSERADLAARVEALQSHVTQLESHTLEMQKLERDLEAERLLREQKTKEHQSAVQEVEQLQAQLSKHTHQLQQTAQELEQLRKGAQQSSLMDMEMADYEKLVKELNHKLSERDRQAEEHQLHTQTQREREQRLSQDIESLKSLLDQTEEKASRMKQLLVKTKKDLGDAKQKEAAQMISQASLRGELEAQQQQLEEYKIQCSGLTAEQHRLQEQLKLMIEQHTHTSRSQRLSVKKLQDESAAAKADLTATVSEFESYKVRVHNVLKQQKHKSSGQSDGDAFRQEREQMEDALEQLRRRLQETQTSLQCSTAELQQLQTDHDTLLERHNKILQEGVSKEAELRERLLSLQAESASLRSEHGQCAAQLSAQTEALRTSFREQTRLLQDEHCRTVETLQQQVNRLETQLYSLQREPASAVHHPQGRKAQADRKPADAPALDLQGDREEGEGMETTETESLSSTTTPLTSLEQLLTSDLKHEPADWLMEPSKEELTVKLNSAARSVEHLNGLLHETEATNAVLTEQITLLKSEVRRLERNHEREKSVANLEYLKNVLLQFIFLRSGSERQALLPVIHTMLQLSPDEKSKLAAIAHGEEQSAVSRGSGWTSYLHSWSGIR